MPGEDLKNIFTDLEFTPVASRLILKAAYKAEKANAKNLDLDAVKASGKKSNESGDEGGGTTSGDQGDNTNPGGSSKGGKQSFKTVLCT
nr:hypothetical protein [uncultured Prevotella sp.]